MDFQHGLQTLVIAPELRYNLRLDFWVRIIRLEIGKPFSPRGARCERITQRR